MEDFLASLKPLLFDPLHFVAGGSLLWVGSGRDGMKRIRLPVVLLLLLLCVYSGVGGSTPNLSWALLPRLAVPGSATLIVLLPRLARMNRAHLVAAVSSLFLALKWAVGLPVWGPASLGTLAELGTLAVTVWLACQLGRNAAAFDQFLLDLALGPGGERRARQGEIYREVQRARAHQRPLGVVVVRPALSGETLAVERLVQEAQQALQHQYLFARLSRTLCKLVAAYTIVAKRNDHFLVVLPEATPETVTETALRLHRAIREELGVEVLTGTAVLPGDALTFDGLVEKALAGAAGKVPAVAADPGAKVALETVLVPEATHGSLDR